MKRIVAVLLIVAAVIFLFACEKKDESDEPVSDKTEVVLPGEKGADKNETKPGEEKKEEEKKTEPKVKYPLSDLTLVDNKDMTVEIIETYVNDEGDFIFKVFCDNKSGKKMNLYTANTTVNGYMVSGFLHLSDVEPGKKMYTEMIFKKNELEQAYIEVVEKVEFDLWVTSYDGTSWSDIADKSFIVYPTGLDAGSYKETERPPVKGELVALDDKGLKLTIEKAYVNKERLSYTLQIYTENETDRELSFEFSDVTVNGVDMEPFWIQYVNAGRKAVSEAEFYLGYFEDSGITEVEEIEFKLIVSGTKIFGDVLYEGEYVLTLN